MPGKNESESFDFRWTEQNRTFFGSSSLSHGRYWWDDTTCSEKGFFEETVNFLGFKHSTISWVPFPWWTSISIIAILLKRVIYVAYLLYSISELIFEICRGNSDIVDKTKSIGKLIFITLRFVIVMTKNVSKLSFYIVVPKTPAWCPGGLTAQKALDASPFITESTAFITEPHDNKLASQVNLEMSVSRSIKN